MDNISALRDIMAQDGFAAQRQCARKHASPIIEGWVGLKAHLASSPVLATTKTKPTWSALRDSMSLDLLFAIIAGRVGKVGVFAALSDKDRCFKRPSGKYEVGRPIGFDHKAAIALADEIKLLKDKPMPEIDTDDFDALTLSDFIEGIDDIAHRASLPLTHISEVMIDDLEFEAEFVSGACDAIRMRGEKDVPPHRTNLGDYFLAHVNADAEEPEPEVIGEYPVIAMPDPDKAKLIDMTLANAELPAIGKLIEQINTATRMAIDWETKAKRAAVPSISVKDEEAVSDDIPSGRVTTKKAYEVFGLKSAAAKKLLDFDVPVWVWDFAHPHVPEVDPNYIFRPFELFRVLYAIITNQRCYLHGHTGTGKTTLVEQVAALLMWPVVRMNFDSEITRMDLIGRDVLTSEGGATVSNFVDGILPQAMSGPYITICDEIDFVRPDVAYVMQRVFEGNGLMLTEDGGRIVKPHKMFRMFATGNTVGQGDEHGMYQGARPQSMAMLDRFTVWIKVDYMSTGDRKKLLKSTAPSLDSNEIDKINQYVGEHLEAFTTAKVLQPISPRTYMAFASAVAMFKTMSVPEPIEQALSATILDRASVQDRAVLNGLSNRVFK